MYEQEQTTKKKRQRPLAPKALTPAERLAMERYLVANDLVVPFPFAADLLPPTPSKPKRKKIAKREAYCD